MKKQKKQFEGNKLKNKSRNNINSISSNNSSIVNFSSSKYSNAYRK